MSELRAQLEFAVDLAYRAGRLTLGHFRTGVTPEMKADDTPVTVADRKAEGLIRDAIVDRFPDHGILGEELGEVNPGATWRWLVDPIDGTKSFVRGLPLYGVLIGLERDGEVVAGVAHFPALDETVAAARGEGCHWNGRRCHVSGTDRLDRAVVSATDVANFAPTGKGRAWERIAASTWYRVGLPDAYGHALVATGRIELMLDPLMNVWDCGPLPVLLAEAGGRFGDWRGVERIDGGEALSCNAALFDEVVGLLDDGERTRAAAAPRVD